MKKNIEFEMLTKKKIRKEEREEGEKEILYELGDFWKFYNSKTLQDLKPQKKSLYWAYVLSLSMSEISGFFLVPL